VGQVPQELNQSLGYIIPVIDVYARRPGNIIDNFWYWFFQGGALFGAAFIFVWQRRLEARDPSRVRKSGAQRALGKKMTEVREQIASSAVDKAAAELERALRSFIADRHDCSPDGLTGNEIIFLLGDDGMPEEKASRFVEIIHQCANVRYAPGNIMADEIGKWADEVVNDLVGGMK